MPVDEGSPSCPVEITLGIIGNKWRIYILQKLMERPYRFSELGRAVDNGISDKVLSRNLKELERLGVVHREVLSARPLQVEYSVTEVGRRLEPVIEAMAVWGREYVRSR